MQTFKLVTEFKPRGDQQKAIDSLVQNISKGIKHQVLLGVTGSGKTFTMANTIAKINRPALIIAHNKTLAAQLYSEFKQLFPENAVEYFVSYYDYYQPEAYLPSTDTYIEKDSSINDNIDKLRHSATRSLLERNDVIIVASVSCIYGLGSPEAYQGMLLYLETGREVSRDKILSKLVEIQYRRNDIDFYRGTFRVRGDIIEIFPVHEAEKAIRVELFGDSLESIKEIDPLRGRVISELKKITIFPSSHYVTPVNKLKTAVENIREELRERIAYFKKENKLVEAQRVEQRTLFDLEMFEELGYCNGIENYSRHLTGRKEGEPPPTLLDYFPKNFLLFIDECHQTIPQIGGMYAGDRSRKTTLVGYGFRLPSALDNRPLSFNEFETFVNQAVYVSATPSEYELKKSKGLVIEQIIRPTGLIDPKIIIKPSKYQVDDLLSEIKERVLRKERVLVTTLTKRMAEDLTEYYLELGLKVKYLHSDIDTLERVKIIRELRLGKFDVLIGINLLREGLDIPEVSLVAVLDADKEGFLRSKTSLIQTCGRAARNLNGTVIFYAEQRTKSIEATLAETERRRKIQEEFNKKNNITPESIVKSIDNILGSIEESDYVTVAATDEMGVDFKSEKELKKVIKKLEKEMLDAAKKLEFEKAAEIRDKLTKLKNIEIFEG